MTKYILRGINEVIPYGLRLKSLSRQLIVHVLTNILLHIDPNKKFSYYNRNSLMYAKVLIKINISQKLTAVIGN